MTKRKGSNKLAEAVTAAPSSSYDDMKYRARDALHTLTRAEEIKRDKALMPHVKREAREQKKALERVCSPKSAPSGRR